jgi:hypothetical protein
MSESVSQFDDLEICFLVAGEAKLLALRRAGGIEIRKHLLRLAKFITDEVRKMESREAAVRPCPRRRRAMQPVKIPDTVQ